MLIVGEYHLSYWTLCFGSVRRIFSARVAYTKVEAQFKLRGIPYTHVNPTSALPRSSALSYMQSSLARSIPALCVQSSDILSGAPAAEAAMANIRVIPLNWWSDKKAQVVTCVKLKYVQQPVGKRAAAGRSSSDIIRPSKRIIYDATEAVVSFLSEQVDTCVDEFLEEWARVSKMVVIAREGESMEHVLENGRVSDKDCLIQLPRWRKKRNGETFDSFRSICRLSSLHTLGQVSCSSSTSLLTLNAHAGLYGID